jgi:Kef-type K+ transport system membrane component KefB
MGVLAEASGSAMIIGAFSAGLILHPTPQRAEIERNVTTLGTFFVPIFFATVGASVDLRALLSGPALGMGAALIVVGVIGKVVAGYAPWWFDGDKLLVGVAMVPRGEVGLIFARMGLASGAITAGLFGALMLMVAVTTVITPPALARIVRRTRGPASGEFPGGGIDDLVAGTRMETGRKTVAFKRPKH